MGAFRLKCLMISFRRHENARTEQTLNLGDWNNERSSNSRTGHMAKGERQQETSSHGGRDRGALDGYRGVGRL
ncbi:hypothetical protein DESC_290173 [Desulfosarcina cetonica]|nr:hypothetical protein DESC_290173 [Desulfosarcina cetonica]